MITNFLLTEREDRTGEYWPEVVAVRTEHSEVRTKTTEGQYSPVRLELQQVAKIVETLHLLGAYLIPLLSLTLQSPSPPPPLISVASKTNKCWELKQSTLKGEGGRGSGKGLNSRCGGHWKLEKVFFNESVSTILQLVV